MDSTSVYGTSSSTSILNSVPSTRVHELLAIATRHLENAKKQSCLGQNEAAVAWIDEALKLLNAVESLASNPLQPLL